MRRSCRIAAERECVLSVTLVVTLGSLPVIALFKSANGQMPSSMRIEDAIVTSPLKDETSDTQMICRLKPGMYIVSYGLKDTHQADAQMMRYSSDALKFFWRRLLNKRIMFASR